MSDSSSHSWCPASLEFRELCDRGLLAFHQFKRVFPHVASVPRTGELQVVLAAQAAH